MIKLFLMSLPLTKKLMTSDDVEDSVLDLKPPTSHEEVEAMLSKCIDWFKIPIQEEANAMQVLLLRKYEQDRSKSSCLKKQKMTDYFV